MRASLIDAVAPLCLCPHASRLQRRLVLLRLLFEAAYPHVLADSCLHQPAEHFVEHDGVLRREPRGNQREVQALRGVVAIAVALRQLLPLLR